MRAPMMTAALAALMTLLLAGCATTEADLKRLRTDVAKQRTDLKAAEAAADAAEGEIGSVDKSFSGRRMYIGKTAMLEMLKGYLPHRFAGSTLSKKRLRGQFRFIEPRGFAFHARNRATWKWEFAASDVRVNLKGVPMTGKKDEKKAREALEAGGVMSMEASIWVDWKKNVLRINARCVGVDLRKHDTSSHRNYLCDGANKTLFKRQQAVYLPRIFRGKRVSATTTPNHLILSSK